MGCFAQEVLFGSFALKLFFVVSRMVTVACSAQEISLGKRELGNCRFHMFARDVRLRTFALDRALRFFNWGFGLGGLRLASCVWELS